MSEKNQKVNTGTIAIDPEVPHQFTFSPYVKSTFDLNSAEVGYPRSTTMQKNVCKVALMVTAEDIAGCQRVKYK